jgi:N utilization substance protein A
MSADLVRFVDSISRDRSIEKELVFNDLEQAIASAVRKQHDQADEVEVHIDRLTGEISALRNSEPISVKALGRIAAQTAKQVMIQKIREDERDSIFEEFADRKGTVVTGTVLRFEGGALIINLGRAEGFLPKTEQIPGESHHPGERIRCLILDVREAPHQVKIVLSRSHPDLIRRLFELEVPEVAERIIEIKALAREAGYRTKIAVSSIDSKVDAVGACVGVRGSRIKNIVVELGGEKIDIVRWNESSQILIGNALKPAEVMETALCFELARAVVVVEEDQLSLAIGKRGQNVRLAARLTGWDIDILTPTEYNRNLDDLEKELTQIEGVDSTIIEKFVAMGLISLMDIEEVGTAPLMEDLDMSEELAQQIVARATEAAKRITAEREAEKAAKEAAQKAAEAQAAAMEAEGGAAPEAEGVAAQETVPEAEGVAAQEAEGAGVTEMDGSDPGEGAPGSSPADVTVSAGVEDPMTPEQPSDAPEEESEETNK